MVYLANGGWDRHQCDCGRMRHLLKDRGGPDALLRIKRMRVVVYDGGALYRVQPDSESIRNSNRENGSRLV